MNLLQLLLGSGAEDASWESLVLLLGAAVLLWILGGAGERLLLRRGRHVAALSWGLLTRAVALVVALRTLPVLAGVDLPFVSDVDWSAVLTTLAVGGVGALVLDRFGRWAERTGEASGRPHAGMIAAKGIRYGGAVLLILLVAESMGWDLTTLLATAGVVGVAVGFAAQTSLSNVIAGVFLLVDRPFEVGDTVEITGQQGVVLEITLLSTRIRTLDNLVVRWPNEVVLKERIVNYSQHPVRRVDVVLRVPVDAPLHAVIAALRQAALDTPPVLLVPEPQAHLRDLDANGASVVVWAWVDREEFVPGRDALLVALQAALGGLGVAPRVPTYTTWMQPPAREATDEGRSGYAGGPEDP